MANAARVHIAERGRNLLRYALVTTGGGGPLHGCEVARKLGIERVLCPPGAGVASALGMMMAPARIDRVATIAQPFDRLDWEEVEKRFAALEQEAIDIVRVSAGADAPIDLFRSADLRCIGQGFEVVTKLPPGPYDANSGETIANAFIEQYRSLYFRPPPRKKFELINIRLSAVARTGRQLTRRLDETSGEPAIVGERWVFFHGSGYLDTPVYRRHRLVVGETIAGPAVIEEPETTLIVPPDMYGRVEANGTIIVEFKASSTGQARVASSETSHA
jgi:N-methylhydantoinase A